MNIKIIVMYFCVYKLIYIYRERERDSRGCSRKGFVLCDCTEQAMILWVVIGLFFPDSLKLPLPCCSGWRADGL